MRQVDDSLYWYITFLYLLHHIAICWQLSILPFPTHVFDEILHVKKQRKYEDETHTWFCDKYFILREIVCIWVSDANRHRFRFLCHHELIGHPWANWLGFLIVNGIFKCLPSLLMTSSERGFSEYKSGCDSDHWSIQPTTIWLVAVLWGVRHFR